jgi:hypothetical protein
MQHAVLPIHGGLAVNSRLPALARDQESLRVAEILFLLGTGAMAALASAFLDLGLRIPGHAIIRAVFPMAFGLALVPRQLSGCVMGIGALAAALAVKAGGAGALGLGAMTSLLLTGPMLDAALWHAKRGWRLYLGFAMAGLASNLVAMAVRGGQKVGGLDSFHGRPLADWLPVAAGTYALCGALAGLISALVWFQFAAKQSPSGDSGKKA